MATADYFLKIEGIEGESTDDKHKGEIDVLNWSFGASNAGSHGRGGGGGSGKVEFQDMHFSKYTCKASPKLLLSCASGTHLKKAVLVARKAGTEQQEFLKITLTDVLVSSYTVNGASGSSIPTEEFSLNFAKVEYEYQPQKADGTLDAAVKSGWDLQTNKKV